MTKTPRGRSVSRWPDIVTVDLIEAAGEAQSKVPEDCNEAIIALFFKKGDPKNIANYRPINLISIIYKLFFLVKIITDRIARALDGNQPHEQGSFLKGFSTTDYLHGTNQLIEICAEYKIPPVIGLVYYSKAFDSIEIPEVSEALEE
ncbi:uncharacterized protein LOC134787306 [Penaeus indicus]|uniref:uncharacterized protein LOC134787306 n=1 Tax=Penaeus indicus TaxID=29960 RepID=UPI00300C5C0C